MLTAWRAIPRSTRCQRPRLLRAGRRRLPMTFASALSFRRPFRIKLHCETVMIWCKNFSPACHRWKRESGNIGCSYPPPFLLAISLLCGRFSMRYPHRLPTGWKFAILNFLPKVKTRNGSIAVYMSEGSIG